MKKQVVLAALVCGLLGSSYAGSSYENESEGDYYWKSAPYDNAELSTFRSTTPNPTNEQQRVYAQSRRLDVPSRFSSSNYADPRDISTENTENYVINDQTGRRVSLNEDQDMSPRMERSSGFNRGQMSTMRNYPQPVAKKPAATYQQPVHNSPFDMSRDFSHGYNSTATPRYAERQERKPVQPLQRAAMEEVQSPDRIFSQAEVGQPQTEVKQPQFASPTSTRRPRVRRNVGSSPAPRAQRTVWYKKPFKTVSRFFSNLFRR